MIKFVAKEFSVDAAGPDGKERRTISGVAVPYNTFATVSDDSEVMFEPGSLPIDGKAPRLFMYHDASQPVGVVTERVDTRVLVVVYEVVKTEGSVYVGQQVDVFIQRPNAAGRSVPASTNTPAIR